MKGNPGEWNGMCLSLEIAKWLEKRKPYNILTLEKQIRGGTQLES